MTVSECKGEEEDRWLAILPGDDAPPVFEAAKHDLEMGCGTGSSAAPI
jgi:hypothetical protein